MRRPGKQGGSVLVIVLWIVVILIVMTAVLAQSSQLSSRISQSYGRRNVCRWGVRAAIETGIQVLSEDDPAYDAFDERWHDSPENFNDIQLTGCTVCVEIIDECSKLNVNTADKKHFLELLEMTVEQADSILDWRDQDSSLRAEGAESDYYGTLDYPYPIRNGPFQTTRELLLVKGLSEDSFFGEDYTLNGLLDANEKDGDPRLPADSREGVPEKGFGAYLTCWSRCKNRDADGSERVNITQADADTLRQKLGLSLPHAKWIEERVKGKTPANIAELIDRNTPKRKDQADQEGDEAKPLDLETFKEIADGITVSDEDILVGRVNINTAPRVVLTALLEGNEQLADEIVAYRDMREQPMTSIADLLDLKTVTIETFKKIAGLVTVRSDVFSLRAQATDNATGLAYTATAIVDRTGTGSDIVYWYEGIGH